ncbi:MAG: glycosyltransferase [Actinomyces sp.]|jgi:hypothetical protein|nr:glycosyltransferase [Actinomyces sp.]MCI1641464.1 glycosyltransferase [Actinomyces sp.]MCI1661792.1 glycosyltransferase [Actinomyces sp.]MCI1690540.1 glycosyltransferase [Actinomyces sp.]MCI1786521.1 glycosyltransferase [Actinomyces sp.]MCI1829958.1 glycosyltransferase [Actinomyces sp.]
MNPRPDPHPRATRDEPQRVAAVIPAHNAERDIASTVRSCRAIPGVDLLVVVDDGSEDDTGRNARQAGAVVVRHSVTRGRASAMETGVKVAAMRDRADWPPRLLLFLSADLGESAVEASALVEAVMSGQADCACAAPPAASPQVGRTMAEKRARWGIRLMTGWEPQAPLSEQRCLTRAALTSVMPFSTGYGLEPGETIDLLVAGFRMVEVPCTFVHLGSDTTIGELNRAARLRDALLAIEQRLLRGVRLPANVRRAAARAQRAGVPYPSDEARALLTGAVGGPGGPGGPRGPRRPGGSSGTGEPGRSGPSAASGADS